MTFKERFPDDAALEMAIDSALPAIVEEVKAVAGPLEADYHRCEPSLFLSLNRSSRYCIC